MSKHKGLPLYLVILDGFGTISLVGAILGATEADIGLPALASIWPLLLILGLAMMAPMVVWLVRKARGSSP